MNSTPLHSTPLHSASLRSLIANSKAIRFLLLFMVLLIAACQKRVDVINQPSSLSQKRLEVSEIKQWVDKTIPTLVDQPTLLYSHAQQTTLNGTHFVRIPTTGKGSDGGSFYFNRKADGGVEVNYVISRIVDSIKGNGIVGMVNLDEKTFRVNVYRNNRLVFYKIVPDSTGLFNEAFLTSTPQIKKYDAGCEVEEVTSILLPDGRDTVITIKKLGGGPNIKCPNDPTKGKKKSWWQTLLDTLEDILEGIGSIFGNGGGGGSSIGGGGSGGGNFTPYNPSSGSPIYGFDFWSFIGSGYNNLGPGGGYGVGIGGGGGGSSIGGGGSQNGPFDPWGPFNINIGSISQEYLLNALKNLTPSEKEWLSQNYEVADDLFSALSEGNYSSEDLLATQITVTTLANSKMKFDKEYFELIKNHILNVSNYSQLDPDPILIHLIVQCALIRIEHPEYSDTRVIWEAWRELLQFGLDVVGLVPVVGEIADLTNGAIYSLYGEGINAGLSFAAAIPIAGWYASGIKFAKKTINTLAGTKTTLKWIVQTDGFINFGLRGQLRTVLGLAVGNSKQAHHIIPWEFWDNVIIQKAARSKKEFHMNDFLNGIALEKSVHIEGMVHTQYSNRVREALFEINRKYNFNISPEDAGKEIEMLISRIRKAIIENPGVNLNQIIF